MRRRSGPAAPPVHELKRFFLGYKALGGKPVVVDDLRGGVSAGHVIQRRARISRDVDEMNQRKEDPPR
jgi:hypothetical protein